MTRGLQTGNKKARLLLRISGLVMKGILDQMVAQDTIASKSGSFGQLIRFPIRADIGREVFSTTYNAIAAGITDMRATTF